MGSRTHRRSTTSILTVALATSLAAAACSDDGGNAQPVGSGSIVDYGPTTTAKSTSTSIDTITTATGPVTNGPGRSRALFNRFDSCDAFLSAVKAKALEQVTPWGLNNPYGYGYPSPLFESGGAATATTAAGAVDQRSSAPVVGDVASKSSGSVSQTNTQEAGIDEGDLVDTDGRSIFTVTDGQTLRVIDITAGKVTDTVALPNGTGSHQLMLDGDHLVVVSQLWTLELPQSTNESDRAVLAPWNQGVNQTRIAVYDVADPSNVKLLDEARVDGSAVAVRNVEHKPRVVIRSDFGSGLAFLQPANQSGSQAALDHNRQIIIESTASDWLPKAYDSAKDTGHQAIGCDNVGMPARYAGMGLVWVASVDLAGDGNVRGAGGVIASGETVYASPSSLYVSSNQWINPIDAAQQKSIGPSVQHTDIHQFDLTDVSGARWVASGSVDGSLLNSYSMSEYDGHLRVATTTQPSGPIMIEDAVADTTVANTTRADGLDTTVIRPQQVTESTSSVTVLARSGEDLSMVSTVGGLGKGQQIYAVRFIGPMGYVVTFRQTDPLYVVDLHDPTRPEVSGELHIAGYSAYLLPVRDGQLVGIGQDAAENTGRVTGAKVSLFDVSDPDNPRETDHLNIGGQSMAEYDPHAITWLDPSLLMGVNDYNSGRIELLVLDVANGSLTERGRLAMPDYQEAQRSVIVGDRIAAIGYDRVVVFDRQSLQQVDTIRF